MKCFKQGQFFLHIQINLVFGNSWKQYEKLFFIVVIQAFSFLNISPSACFWIQRFYGIVLSTFHHNGCQNEMDFTFFLLSLWTTIPILAREKNWEGENFHFLLWNIYRWLLHRIRKNNIYTGHIRKGHTFCFTFYVHSHNVHK